MSMGDLHERIAKALGWSTSDVRSFSMQSLRDLVRPVDPNLAREMDYVIQSGAYVRGEPQGRRRHAIIDRNREPKREPGLTSLPLPFERKPQIPSRWHNRYHKERVPIDRMIATQRYVTEKGVKQQRLAPKHDIDLPMIYRTDDGRLYIADGHHRVAAAIARGEQNVMSRVVDIGDPDNPREPREPSRGHARKIKPKQLTCENCDGGLVLEDSYGLVCPACEVRVAGPFESGHEVPDYKVAKRNRYGEVQLPRGKKRR